MTRIDIPFPPRIRSTAHRRVSLDTDSVSRAADVGAFTPYPRGEESHHETSGSHGPTKLPSYGVPMVH